MSRYCNVELDGKTFGVIVSQSKNLLFFRKTSKRFIKDTADVKSRLVDILTADPKIKKSFLKGKSIMI